MDQHVHQHAYEQWSKAATSRWWTWDHHDIIPRASFPDGSYKAETFFTDPAAFQKVITDFNHESVTNKGRQKGEESAAGVRDQTRELKNLYGNEDYAVKGGKRMRTTGINADRLLDKMRISLLPFSSVQVSAGPYTYLVEIPVCPVLLNPRVTQEQDCPQYWKQHPYDDYWQFGRYIVLEVRGKLQETLREANIVFNVESHKSHVLDAESGLSFQVKDEEDVQNDDFHFRLCKSVRPGWTLKDDAGYGDLCYVYPACGKWRQHSLQRVLLARCKDDVVVAAFIRVLQEKGLTKFWTNSIYSTASDPATRNAHVADTIFKLEQQGVALPSKTDAMDFAMQNEVITSESFAIADAYHRLLQ